MTAGGRKWSRFSPRRLLIGLASVQEYELIEVRQLAAEVLARMKKLQTGVESRHEAWVAAEFQYPLRSLLIKAAFNSSLFLGISMVVVAGGFATSGITVAANASQGSLAAWIVFSIGLLVALAGGLAQIFRFGVRSNERRTSPSCSRKKAGASSTRKAATPTTKTPCRSSEPGSTSSSAAAPTSPRSNRKPRARPRPAGPRRRPPRLRWRRRAVAGRM